jgi:SAM-dependent methyltransferase
MSIGDDDLVLEIGPGAYPYWRSDCLVDKFDNRSVVDISQFGGAPQRTLGKPFFKMENNTIPFKDNAFDYVICSHVLEHVSHSELDVLLSEIARVSKKAYLEFPRTIYEFIYDFDVHLNLLDIVDGNVICLPKTKTALQKVKRYTMYALRLRETNNFSIERINPSIVAVGREFEGPIPFKIYDSEEEFFEVLSHNIIPVEEASRVQICSQHIARIKRKLSNKPDETFFERLLK